MKLSEILKSLGLKFKEGSNDELEPATQASSASTSPPPVQTVPVPNSALSGALISKEHGDVSKILEKEGVKNDMGLPKYDVKSGLFDLSSVEDVELKNVLKMANENVKANKNNELIQRAIENKIASVKTIDGISKDILNKLVDKTAIKVNEDGTVAGVDEAFEKLKEANAGLFVPEKTEVKTPVSNPILEGFNPVQTSVTGKINSFEQAIALERGLGV